MINLYFFIIFSAGGSSRFNFDLRNKADILVGFFALQKTSLIHNTVVDNLYNLEVEQQLASLVHILHFSASLAFDFRSLSWSGPGYFQVNLGKVSETEEHMHMASYSHT